MFAVFVCCPPTAFGSGLTASDLDPGSSPHHLVHQRTAYLKLRALADRGCVFVGHGQASKASEQDFDPSFALFEMD